MRPTARAGLAGALAALTPVACTAIGGGPSITPQEQLRTRPSFETAQDGYLRMLTDMRTALSAQVATLAWIDDAPSRDGLAGCKKPFDAVSGAQSAVFTSGSARGAIPDTDWPSALSAVTQIAACHGFTKVVTVVDKPGNHVMSIYDDYAAEVMFGTEVNTVLDVFGACFIAEAAISGP
jgi:hypothetical protein